MNLNETEQSISQYNNIFSTPPLIYTSLYRSVYQSHYTQTTIVYNKKLLCLDFKTMEIAFKHVIFCLMFFMTNIVDCDIDIVDKKSLFPELPIPIELQT